MENSVLIAGVSDISGNARWKACPGQGMVKRYSASMPFPATPLSTLPKYPYVTNPEALQILSFWGLGQASLSSHEWLLQQTGWIINNENLFLIVSENSRSVCQRGGGVSPLLGHRHLAPSSHGRKDRKLTLISFIMALISLMRAPHSELNLPETPPLLVPSHRALGFQHMVGCWGDGNIWTTAASLWFQPLVRV